MRTARLVENLFPFSKVRDGLGDTRGKSGLALLLLQEKAKGCVFHKKTALTLAAGCHLHHLPTCPPLLRPGERTSESAWSGGLVSAAALDNLPFQAIPTAPHWPRANPVVISDLCRASKSQRKKKKSFKHLKNMWKAVVAEAIFGHLFRPFFCYC